MQPKNTSHLEKIFFKNIISNPDYLEKAKQRFFDNKVISKLFKIIFIWWDKYSEIPSKEQIWEIIKMKELEEEIPYNQLEAIWDVDLSSYDDDWLEEYTEFFIEWKNLESSGLDFVQYLKSTEVTPENIREVVENAKRIIVDGNNIDFKFREGSDFFNPESHVQPIYNTFSTGFPFMDLVGDGGFRAKSLSVFVGQAKIGKSLWLGNVAAQAIRNGHNVAIITMEMEEALYHKRIGSNLLEIPVKEYKKLSQDQEFMKGKIKNFKVNNLREPGHLHIREFPTSTASTIDIDNYLLKMEEKLGIKFKVVIIDYINIMKNWRNPNSENTYMKIKQIAEDLRGLAMKNEWAIVTATQTKQSSFDANDMGMNAVAESSGLVATVDLMFAIIQDPLMYSNKQYKLKVLANRNEGYKNASKRHLVDYNYMRIREDETAEIVDDGI